MISYNDNAAHPSPWAPPSDSSSLDAVLIEAGVPTAALDEVVRIFEVRCEAAANVRAAEAISHISACLGNTPAGWALRRALSGRDNSLERDAKKAGVKKQTLHESEKRIRARLSSLQTTP